MATKFEGPVIVEVFEAQSSSKVKVNVLLLKIIIKV